MDGRNDATYTVAEKSIMQLSRVHMTGLIHYFGQLRSRGGRSQNPTVDSLVTTAVTACAGFTSNDSCQRKL